MSAAFKAAHELGLATILWCYTRNNAFKVGGVDYHVSADLTGQANHLGVTIEADIIKQKLPENNGGYRALRTGDSSYGKLDARMYTELSSDHPIDLTRYQVLNNYAGRMGLINSDGPSGQNDIPAAALVDPPLTTVAAPAREMGAQAMRMLKELIAGRPPALAQIVLPVSLLVRASCGVHP